MGHYQNGLFWFQNAFLFWNFKKWNEIFQFCQNKISNWPKIKFSKKINFLFSVWFRIKTNVKIWNFLCDRNSKFWPKSQQPPHSVWHIMSGVNVQEGRKRKCCHGIGIVMSCHTVDCRLFGRHAPSLSYGFVQNLIQWESWSGLRSWRGVTVPSDFFGCLSLWVANLIPFKRS